MHPSPQEFYYQVGDAAITIPGDCRKKIVRPRQSRWRPCPVFFGIGANLAGRTAAAFATASRLYAPYDKV